MNPVPYNKMDFTKKSIIEVLLYMKIPCNSRVGNMLQSRSIIGI